MSTSKSKVFDTDYYSASAYEEENQNTTSVYKQIFIVLAILAIVALVYLYFTNNNATSASVVSQEAPAEIVTKEVVVAEVPKEQVVKELPEATVNTEVVKVIEPKAVEVIEAKVEKKEVPVVPKVNKELTAPTQVSVTNDNVLTAEYIKQVKESLGNY